MSHCSIGSLLPITQSVQVCWRPTMTGAKGRALNQIRKDLTTIMGCHKSLGRQNCPVGSVHPTTKTKTRRSRYWDAVCSACLTCFCLPTDLLDLQVPLAPPFCQVSSLPSTPPHDPRPPKTLSLHPGLHLASSLV